MAAQVPAATVATLGLASAFEPRSERSLHQRLEGALRELIASGRVRPGAVIPGELELAAQLRLSRHTVRHALGVLTQEGLLRRERGRGTTVVSGAPPQVIERSLRSFYAFAWEARAAGGEQRSYVIERTAISADELMAERLAVAPGSAVERIVRVRTLDREPLILETAHLARTLTAGLDDEILERGSIYDAFERLQGVRVVRAHETIRPTILRRANARLLGVASGTAAFFVERITWSEHAPIEWQTSLVRGDRYLYSVDLPRTG